MIPTAATTTAAVKPQQLHAEMHCLLIRFRFMMEVIATVKTDVFKSKYQKRGDVE